MRTELTSIKEIPGMHLMGQTCANLNGELFFIWGGTHGDQDDQQQAQVITNNDQAQQEDQHLLTRRNADLWIYETLSGYWRHRRCSGECPPYLSSCSSCLIGQRMFVFGGHSTALDDWLNCLFCLNLETFEWTDLGSQATALEPTKPIRSDKNICWSYNNKLYIFGGYGWSRTEHYMDILDRQRDFQLTPDFRWPKFGWNNQLVEFDPVENAWRWPKYHGKCPSARAAHAGTLMSDDKVYLFGGRDSQERLNDLYTFDMKTFEWMQLAVIEAPGSSLARRPINHLLEIEHADPFEPMDDDDVQDILRVQEDEEEEEEEVAPEHGQIVDIISLEQVSLERPLIDDPMPSSSNFNRQQKCPNPRSTCPFLEHLESDDEDEDYYPHPSHVLERLSLSSQQQFKIDSGDCFDLANSDCSETQNSPGVVQNANRAPALIDGANQDLAEAAVADQIDAEHELGDHANHQPQSEEHEPNKPIGRSFCSFTPLTDEEILLYGGVSSQDKNLDDCWSYNIKSNKWTNLTIDLNVRHRKPRLWHSGLRTKQNEVVIIGGSSSDKIDEFCSDVLIISQEAKSLKRLALDAVVRSIRLKAINQCPDIPSTINKLIRLRKQAISLTSIKRSQAG